VSTETGIATPQSAVSVRVQLRGHTLLQDKPQASGGQDKGPMASEFLIASLLACQNSTFAKIAAKRKLEANIVSLTGEMDFDAAGDISALRVRFEVAAPASVADDAIQTAMRLTDKTCTISRVLKVPVTATLARKVTG
jgi:uncharacterized OsmC-like protein